MSARAKTRSCRACGGKGYFEQGAVASMHTTVFDCGECKGTGRVRVAVNGRAKA